MSKYLYIILAILISGCNESEPNALYRCSPEQLDVVRIQFDICKETNYKHSYCLDTAKKEQCDEIELQNEVKRVK